MRDSRLEECCRDLTAVALFSIGWKVLLIVAILTSSACLGVPEEVSGQRQAVLQQNALVLQDTHLQDSGLDPASESWKRRQRLWDEHLELIGAGPDTPDPIGIPLPGGTPRPTGGDR